MKNKKKKYIKSILFLLFAIFLLFFINILHIHIALACPNITYQGDKTVLKEDVIYLGSIKIRDLRIDKYREFNNTKQCHKYYIIKNTLISQKKLHEKLSSFCYKCFEEQNEFDEIHYTFYDESPTMPWFWNNEGYFPDLEWNQDNIIAAYGVNNLGMKYWLEKMFFSKERTGYIDRKCENHNSE